MEKAEVGRGVVQETGQRAAGPVEESRGGLAEASRVGLEPFQGGYHGHEDAGEQDGDLPERVKVEVVGLVDGFAVVKNEAAAAAAITDSRRRNRVVDEHPAQNDQQPKDVAQALEAPSAGQGVFFEPRFGRSPAVIESVESEKRPGGSPPPRPT